MNEVFRYQKEADNQGRANDTDARRRAAEADRNAARFVLLAPSQRGSSLGRKLLECPGPACAATAYIPITEAE